MIDWKTLTRTIWVRILVLSSCCVIALAGSAIAAPSHRVVVPEVRATNFIWDYVSAIPVLPGTLVDGSPLALQDQSLNSSFVVIPLLV